jgi:hypothetical protein
MDVVMLFHKTTPGDTRLLLLEIGFGGQIGDKSPRNKKAPRVLKL